MSQPSVITLLVLILSACAPSAPTLVPVTPTASVMPTQTGLPTPTLIPTAVPDTLFVARELIHQYTDRDLPIAVTEFNSAYDKSFGGETTPDSHYNVIRMENVLGSMIKNGVFMANQWYLTAKAGYGGLGLVGQSDVFPSYYTY